MAKMQFIDTISVNVSVPREKYRFSLKAPVGGTFYTVAQEDEQMRQCMEFACGGNAACSTCHVVVDPAHFALLPQADEAELDMLDLAAGVTETSRLGCQIRFTPSMEGLSVVVPAEVNNLFGNWGGKSV